MVKGAFYAEMEKRAMDACPPAKRLIVPPLPGLMTLLGEDKSPALPQSRTAIELSTLSLKLFKAQSRKMDWLSIFSAMDAA